MRRSFVLLLVLAACTVSETPPTAESDVAATRAALEALDVNAMRWMANGAADSLVTGYYASDAVVMSPNTPVANGTEAIRTAWTELSKAALVRLQSKIERMYVADSIATTQGSYTFQLRPKPPADTSNFIVSDRGSYVTTFVKRGGAWRAVFDIATSEVPLPGSAPAATAASKP